MTSAPVSAGLTATLLLLGTAAPAHTHRPFPYRLAYPQLLYAQVLQVLPVYAGPGT